MGVLILSEKSTENQTLTIFLAGIAAGVLSDNLTTISNSDNNKSYVSFFATRVEYIDSRNFS